MEKLTQVFKRVFTLVIVTSLVALLFAFTLSAKATDISINGVDLVYTNPGEDCSTQITISWHAKAKYSTLVYTLKSDSSYEYATSMRVGGNYDDTSFVHYDVAKFYKCSVALKDLEPDTEYIYKITCEEFTTEQYTFKTAGAAEYTFGYMSDIHAVPYDYVGKDEDLGIGKDVTAVKKMQIVQTLIKQAERVNDTKLAFLITSGDEVWRGSQYTNWQEWSKTSLTSARKDYLWLSCPGNHEYYTQTTNSIWNYFPLEWDSNRDKIYSSPTYFYNTYFNAVKSVPKNGPKDIPSCYYTLYNNILFVCIDSMQSGDYDHIDEIKVWFENVVKANEGKYQYLIAYQHYPWYDFVTGADKYAGKWYEVFDRCGVDLALSGHMHGYLRTKTLYGGKESADGKGTVYVVSPQVGDRPKVTSDFQNKNLIAYRESTITWPDYSAMSTITVTQEGLTYKLIDVEGTVHDEFTITAKRAMKVSEANKTAIINSLTMSSSSDSIICDFKSGLSLYVSEMKLTVNGKTETINPSELKCGSIEATGLSNNTLYDAKVELTFNDGSKYDATYKTVTSNTYGLINNLKAIVNNGKMNIIWDADASKVSEYKLYLDGVFVSSSTTNQIEVSLDKVTFSTKYTLEAYKDNKILFIKDFFYNVYGDVNLDGKLDEADVNKLIELIFAGYTFNSGAVKLLDNNGDGIVDIGDAFRILAYKNNKVDSIVNNEYEVVFIGFDSAIILKARVSEGNDATAPTAPVVAGYEFIGWSISYTNVTSNLIVRAMYEAK